MFELSLNILPGSGANGGKKRRIAPCWATLDMPVSVHAICVESLGAAARCGVARARFNCNAGVGDDIQPLFDFVRQ